MAYTTCAATLWHNPIDPTRTICADYSQGNEALFGENTGTVISGRLPAGNLLILH